MSLTLRSVGTQRNEIEATKPISRCKHTHCLCFIHSCCPLRLPTKVFIITVIYLLWTLRACLVNLRGKKSPLLRVHIIALCSLAASGFAFLFEQDSRTPMKKWCCFYFLISFPLSLPALFPPDIQTVKNTKSPPTNAAGKEKKG